MSRWAAAEEETPAAEVHPSPVARVVKLAGLDAALPPGTARVSRAERRAAIEERLRQISRLQGN